MVRIRGLNLMWLIWVVVGIVVAWQRGYITVGLLEKLLSAALAVALWFLVLLGINLHIG